MNTGILPSFEQVYLSDCSEGDLIYIHKQKHKGFAIVPNKDYPQNPIDPDEGKIILLAPDS